MEQNIPNPQNYPLISALALSEGVNYDTYRASVWCLDTQYDGIMPEGFRTMADDFAVLPDLPTPTREGLDSLGMTGSGQFTSNQLTELASLLRNTPGQAFVIDLRQEPHLLVDDTAVSKFGKRNRTNIGLSTQQVQQQEAHLAAQQLGQPLIAALPLHEELFDQTLTLRAMSVSTEQAACSSVSLGYLRYAVMDRSWPVESIVDKFIADMLTLPENAKVHFHCKAGKGRTGEFMVMYDILKNPQLPVEDIAIRQHLLGAGNMLFEGDPATWMHPYDKERVRMTRLFSAYAKDCWNDDYQTPWSVWLASQKR